MIHPAVAVLLLALVQLTTQQPPGVPPKQHNQPPQQHNQPPQHHQQQQQHHQQQQQHQQQPQAHEEHGHHGKPLQFASEVHNADHILEHLEKVVATKSKDQMTEEELEFHYFKLHDYDNNNKLDGVEIGKALTHFHDENDKGSDENKKIFEDSEISNIVDSVIQENDENKDGYIEYFEFKRRQATQKEERSKSPPPPEH
ncbi:multiple coagulation factor deficiency protein 2 homolog isoform X2 [Physella acuta]|uniref:multiple coagulation factor deficiency protein 2 homolog isoform X2 n=1 Tax=Physella acuta TaxID=109671 RepID=UPI0027DC57E2|nr:multiple coagulation factor deficiency protein 2 homolog isoform X2 [Physella acuta]